MPIHFIRPSLTLVFFLLLYIEGEIWSDEMDRNRNLGSFVTILSRLSNFVTIRFYNNPLVSTLEINSQSSLCAKNFLGNFIYFLSFHYISFETNIHWHASKAVGRLQRKKYVAISTGFAPHSISSWIISKSEFSNEND